MAGEIASAYVSIYPKLTGESVTSLLKSEMSGAGTSSGASFVQRAKEALTNGMHGAGKSGGEALANGFSVAKVAVGNIIGDLAMDAANKFKDAFGEGIAQSDALKKFASTMEFAGFDTSQIEQVQDAMKDYASQTVYDLDEIMNTTAKLAANGVSDFDSLVQAAGNLNAAAGGNSESFGYFANAITQVNGAGKLMAQDWNQIVNALPGASGAIQNELKEMGAWDESMGTFKDAMAAGEISADEFNQAIHNLGMTEVAQEAATSTDTFEGAMGVMQASVTDFMQGIYDSINANGLITNSITAIGDAFTAAIPFVSAGVTQLIEWLGQLWAYVQPVLSQVLGLFQVVWPTVQNILGTAVEIMGGVVSAVFPVIADTISVALEFVQGVVSAVSAAMSGDWSGALNLMQSAVTNAMSGIRNILGRLAGIVKSAVSGAGSWLFSAGQNIIRGLCNGISGAVGWVISAVQSVCSNALDALKSFFGIGSPSKLMAEMGGYMMEGLANGIAGGTSTAVNAMGAAGMTVAGAFSSGKYTPMTRYGAATSGGSLIDEVRALRADVQNVRIVLDSGALVGGISKKMDGSLGRRQQLAGRGVS